MKDKVIGWSENTYYCNRCEQVHGKNSECKALSFNFKLKHFFEANGYVVFETGEKREADGFVWTIRVTK